MFQTLIRRIIEGMESKFNKLYFVMAIFLHCYHDSWVSNSRKVLSDEKKNALFWGTFLYSSYPSSRVCNDGIIFYPTFTKKSLSFIKNRSYIRIISDKKTSLKLTSDITELESNGRVSISKDKLLYSSSNSLFSCSDLTLTSNMINGSTGYFQVIKNSNKDISITFDNAGYYLLYLETGDPNFNPTDIYAVME